MLKAAVRTIAEELRNMRGRVRSGFWAFGYGLLLAGGVGAAAVATHDQWAPPGPDSVDRALMARVATARQELAAYVDGWTASLREAVWSENARPVIGTAHAAITRVQQDWIVATSERGSRRLISDIQSELQRVGCYAGRIDGAWTGSTKSAAATFTDRTRVRLTFTEPDWVLLTMLQGHLGPVCGDDSTVQNASHHHAATPPIHNSAAGGP